MSDGGRNRASLGTEVWKSSQKWSVQRSVVRSIAWLGLLVHIEDSEIVRFSDKDSMLEQHVRNSKLVSLG
jgi:hypothetical protein